MDKAMRLGTALPGRGLRLTLVGFTAIFLAVLAAGPVLADSTQGTGVSNDGDAGANTGVNAGTGNGSGNDSFVGQGDPASGSVLGGLVGVGVNLGGSNNSSTGQSDVNTGTANAAGNQSSTGVAQNGSNATGTNTGQGISVVNSGSSNANTGGNTSVGNDSNNRSGVNQDVGGGLVGLGVNLGSANNVSGGTSNLTTGAANAVGNSAVTNVNQNGLVGAAGTGAAGDLCVVTGPQVQGINVRNSGESNANSGGNRSAGNASSNNSGVSQAVGGGDGGPSSPGVPSVPLLGGLLGGITGGLVPTGLVEELVSGGLVNVAVNLGSANNASDGTSNLTTGQANAAGNQSTTGIAQNRSICDPVRRVTTTGTVGGGGGGLALTGFDTLNLAALALALLIGGVLLAGPARQRRLALRTPVTPVAVVRGWDVASLFMPAKSSAKATRSSDVWDDAVEAGSPSASTRRSSRIESLV